MNVKLNETPVRTSRNFQINNLKLDIDIPTKIKEFENIEIINQESKITKEIELNDLVYGNGEELEENNIKYSNNKIRIETKKEDIKLIYNFDDKNLELINQIEIIGNNDANIIIEYKSNTNNKNNCKGKLQIKYCNCKSNE